MMTAILRSNDGEQEVAFEFDAVVDYACEQGLESTVRWTGRHWDGDHTFPQSICISGLWLRLESLTALCRHITQWSHLPLVQLIPDRLDGTFDLCRLPEQVASFRFGSLADTISGLNPVLSMSLCAGTLQSSFHFVTDQSCLTSFAAEVQSALSKCVAHA